MTFIIDIQQATTTPIPLSDQELTSLAILALTTRYSTAELTIRLVDEQEMTYLNATYRKKNKTTNVLAFPSTVPSHVSLDCPFLGDIIICPKVLEDESKALGKSLIEHWTLIVLHGVLHLQGYNHIQEEEASIMQALEIQLLAELGFTNPYDLGEINHE